MIVNIDFDEEELEELDSILSRELTESRSELRHTWDANYRERVRHHIELVEHMIRTTEHAHHSQEHHAGEHPVGG